MKILIFSHEFPPDIGGAGVVAQQNAKALSKIGHNVTVLTRKQKDLIAESSYKIISVPVISKLWFLSYRKAIDYNSFDLIILNDPASIYVAGLYFSSVLFQKTVVFLHGSEAESIFEKPRLPLKITLFKHFYTSSLKQCKKIYAVSNYMKDMFVRRTGMTALQDKIYVYYAGVDTQQFFPEKDNEFRKKWNIPEDAILMLSVSRITKEKGFYDKFCLFKELCNEDNLYWLIAGKGEYIETIKKLAKENNIEDRLIYAGAKKREELRYFYSNADIFWLLSNRDGESFGLVYIEAQACGLPVIGRNRAGVVEAIFNEKTGFLVDNDEQIKTIIKNKLYKNLHVSDILDFSKKFNVENNIEQLLG